MSDLTNDVYVVTREVPSVDHPASSVEGQRLLLGVYRTLEVVKLQVQQDIDRRNAEPGQDEVLRYDLRYEDALHGLTYKRVTVREDESLCYWKGDEYTATRFTLDKLTTGYL